MVLAESDGVLVNNETVPPKAPVPYKADPAPLITSTRLISIIGKASNFISPLSADNIGNPSNNNATLLPTPKAKPDEPRILT